MGAVCIITLHYLICFGVPSIVDAKETRLVFLSWQKAFDCCIGLRTTVK